MKEVGLLIENKKTGKQFEVWFESEKDMEKVWNLYSISNYRVIKYLSDQQTINFYD